MNIKLGLNFSKFHFEPKCKDEIQTIDTLTSIDGKYTIYLGEDNLYRLVTDDPNAFMDLNIYKDMEFINESARIRKLTKNNGVKESEGKLMTTELDSRFTKEMAKVMTINKSKYPRGNKYKELDPIELFEAMERHLLAVKEHLQYGTSLVDDDNCNHIAKIATNADMLFVQLNLKNGNKSK